MRLTPKFNVLKNKGYYPLGNLADTALICAFSSRSHGNMSLVYGETEGSLDNRKNFLTSLGIDSRNLVCAKQVHGTFARYVKEEDQGSGALTYATSIADTDALITDKKNLALAVFTADCLSLFLYDPAGPAVGLVHAGWRSAKGSIAGAAIKLMGERFNTKPQDLYIGFGPAIRGCCYEVGKDFGDFFPQELNERNNRYYLDLVQINKKQLLGLGIKKTNIFDSGICTSCRNEEFFSYRKEAGSCGRMMSVIMLK